MNCLACTDPLPNDARLCEPCTHTLNDRLAELPEQYAELALHLRPGVGRSDGPVALVREAPLPVNQAVLDLRAAGGIVTVLEGWREAMQDARGWGAPARSGTIEQRVIAAARGLALNMDFIAGEFDGAGDLYSEVRELSGACRAILDPDPEAPGPYVADCAAELPSGAICGRPLRVDASHRSIRCRACGTDYPPSMWMALASNSWATDAGAAA